MEETTFYGLIVQFMFNITDELIYSFCLGILAAIALSYWYFAKKNKSSSSLPPTTLSETNKSTVVTTPFKLQKVGFRKNLDVETVLDLQTTLALLEKYQKEPNTELFEIIQGKLQGHTKAGNNAIHEYLQQHEVKTEIFETMLEIAPELLWEENAAGESVLHIAVDHQHFEIIDSLLEEKHFHSTHAHELFLEHRDHNRESSLHHALEETWIHLYGEAYLNEFLHMLEKHPIGALFWKDKEGKTVYEHYFEHKEANGKKLVETLIHKGVLVHHDGQLELASETIREKIVATQQIENEEVNKLLELCVVSYPETIHHHNKVRTENSRELLENLVRHHRNKLSPK